MLDTRIAIIYGNYFCCFNYYVEMLKSPSECLGLSALKGLSDQHQEALPQICVIVPADTARLPPALSVCAA